jgi:hypothetical protein
LFLHHCAFRLPPTSSSNRFENVADLQWDIIDVSLSLISPKHPKGGLTYGRTHYNGKSIHPMRPSTQMSSDVADRDSGELSGYLFLVSVSLP